MKTYNYIKTIATILLFFLLLLSSCTQENNKDNYNISGIWKTRESLYSITSANEGCMCVLMTSDGRFYPLSESYDRLRYRYYEIVGNSLVLGNNDGTKSYYPIMSQSDTLFSVIGYPEYRDTLHFEKITDFQDVISDSVLFAIDYSEDSLNIIMENIEQNLPCSNSIVFVLSYQQMQKANRLLTEYYHEGYIQLLVESGVYVRLGYPLDLYFKRYVGFKQDGHVKVYVALDFSLNKGIDGIENYDAIKNSSIHIIQDGGPGHGEVVIDLDAEKVESLCINGFC